MVSARAAVGKEAVMSRRQIEGLIAEGKSIFVFNQKVIRADFWLAYHPGGHKVIQHMIGRDATDEITVYVVIHDCPKWDWD